MHLNIRKILQDITVNMPYTYPSIIHDSLNDSYTILDIGCGNGHLMSMINSNKELLVTGVDLFQPYLDNAKKTGCYKKLIKMDIRKLRFDEASFDCVLSSHVVEHFRKEDAFEQIKIMEKIAQKKIIIGTPNGYFPQDPYDGNDLQEHFSEWGAEDFEKLGFRVYGQGAKFIYGYRGLLNGWMGSFLVTRFFLFFLSYLLSPIIYNYPRYSLYLIAVKKK